MAKVKFFIRVSAKKDTAPIRVRFYNGKRFDTTARTRENVKLNYWNKTKGKYRKVSGFFDYTEKQKKLDDLERFILNEYSKTASDSIINGEWLATTIDKYYDPDKYKTTGITLFKYIERFIANAHKRINPSTGNPVSYKMRREYEVTFEYLKLYAEKYGEPNFEDIDLQFHANFVDLLRDAGLRINTIGKKIQTLKIFLNKATEEGVNTNTMYKSRSFTIPTEEPDNFALTIEELNKIYSIDLSQRPGLERVRDLFIISCWTGVRYSDLYQINKNRIDDGILQVTQNKTLGKIWIPLHPMVEEIFEKYDYQLPKPISNQKYNKALKEIGKLAGLTSTFNITYSLHGKRVDEKARKCDKLSSHTARRTFCTIQYEMDIPTLTIMAISGHRTEKAFLKYIKVDGKGHAEKLKRIWKEKGFGRN
jgi:site-specific recombinase XerD